MNTTSFSRGVLLPNNTLQPTFDPLRTFAFAKARMGTKGEVNGEPTVS